MNPQTSVLISLDDLTSFRKALHDASEHIRLLSRSNSDLQAENTTLRGAAKDLGRRNQDLYEENARVWKNYSDYVSATNNDELLKRGRTIHEQAKQIEALQDALNDAISDAESLETIVKAKTSQIDRLTDELAEAYHPEFGTVPELQARVGELERQLAEAQQPKPLKQPSNAQNLFPGAGIKVLKVPQHLMPPGVDWFLTPPLSGIGPVGGQIIGFDFSDVETRFFSDLVSKTVQKVEGDLTTYFDNPEMRKEVEDYVRHDLALEKTISSLLAQRKDDLLTAAIFGGLTQTSQTLTPDLDAEPRVGSLERTLVSEIVLNVDAVLNDLHGFRTVKLYDAVDSILDEVEAYGTPAEDVPYLDDVIHIADEALDNFLAAFFTGGDRGEAEQKVGTFGTIRFVFTSG